MCVREFDDALRRLGVVERKRMLVFLVEACSERAKLDSRHLRAAGTVLSQFHPSMAGREGFIHRLSIGVMALRRVAEVSRNKACLSYQDAQGRRW
jgi:hypothetical protein